jgi:hypothetical protein
MNDFFSGGMGELGKQRAEVYAPHAAMSTLVTARDRDIFRALARCPLTVRQLLKMSETFAVPFSKERRLQRRLQALAAADLIKQWRYDTTGPGVPCYYTLSPEGHRLLHGHDEPLPGHRVFEALSSSRQQHTQALADFIVHTVVAAHRAGFVIADFHREGSLQVQVGQDFLYPDCAFRLVTTDGRSFDYFVELDNGTEAVRTFAGTGSFERKLRIYEAYKDQCRALRKDHRFRVILVTTGTDKRLGHMLDRAREILIVKQRPLVYGATLSDYLGCDMPLTSRCLRDHLQEARALVPPTATTLSPTAQAAAMALATVGPPDTLPRLSGALARQV